MLGLFAVEVLQYTTNLGLIVNSRLQTQGI